MYLAFNLTRRDILRKLEIHHLGVKNAMLSENATITLLESGADTVRPWRYIYLIYPISRYLSYLQVLYLWCTFDLQVLYLHKHFLNTNIP